MTRRFPLLLKKKPFFTLVTVLACFTSLTTLASKSIVLEFNEVIVNSPYKLTQEIIAADLLVSPGKELLTFSVDEEGNRWLMIYQLNDKTKQYAIAQKSIIPKQFYRFDLSEPKDGQGQKIYFLSTDRLVTYQDKKFKPLAKIESLYVQEQVDFLSKGDFIQDLNNDNFDDVIIADFNKTHILIGQGMNSFTRQTLPIKPEVRVFSSGASYTQTKLYFCDVNFDKKTDILLVGDGEMIIYPQYDNSQFSSKAIPLAINEAISGTEWWNKRDESGEQLDQSDLYQ
ncbi:MAG: VCBS repeat-containing protein [Colwellia sp.]|nr:VCBS repeat-containing protein [Colwellia sp.]